MQTIYNNAGKKTQIEKQKNIGLVSYAVPFYFSPTNVDGMDDSAELKCRRFDSLISSEMCEQSRAFVLPFYGLCPIFYCSCLSLNKSVAT